MAAVRLVEPGRYVTRGNFHRPYVVAAADRLWRKSHRLMDLLTVVIPETDPDYLDPPAEGEFCVVDVVTREKGFFEHLPELDADRITTMCTSHFDSDAFRVGPSMWFV